VRERRRGEGGGGGLDKKCVVGDVGDVGGNIKVFLFFIFFFLPWGCYTRSVIIRASPTNSLLPTLLHMFASQKSHQSFILSQLKK
jgi:hypothetical protein